MSYLVLARKYRPQIFEDVVGQAHVTQTLINAVIADRVAHAILFAGPRGTGKTTVARVLAKAMNCIDGPIPTPCNVCRSCREITLGGAVDVYEIDGASNNSVEQVREIRDNIQYMPALSRYKIYIIDEVHMLSKSAFNALLKTLEEPPAHILFMFATTEVQKIPITILSRCQRHDFRRIPMESIIRHMEDLCVREKVGMPAESLNLIAKVASGSMRDALSLLDQIISSQQGEIVHDTVLDLLGIVDRTILFKMAMALIKADMAGLLEIVHDIYRCGSDIIKVYEDLITHFRNLIILKMDPKATKLIDVPSDEIPLLREQVKDIPISYLTDLFKLLFDQESFLRFSSSRKLALEMVFFKAIQIKPTLSIDTLIEKLDHLRKEFYDPSNTTHGNKDVQPVEERVRKKPEKKGNDSIDTPPLSEASYPVGDMPYSVNRPDQVKESDPVKGFDTEDSLSETWGKIRKLIAEKSPGLSANLAKSVLEKVTDKELEIQVNGNGFNLKIVKRPKNKASIQKACSEYFGKDVDIRLKTGKRLENKQNSLDETERKKKEALNHPLVSDAIEVFNGKIVEVRMIREEKNEGHGENDEAGSEASE